jgi:hypothetical protein
MMQYGKMVGMPKMPGRTMHVSMLKADGGGNALRWGALHHLGLLLVCLTLAIFALSGAPAQACGRHHSEPHSIVHGSASLVPAAIVGSMSMIDRCGLPGPSDQNRCACCTTNSPLVNSAGVALTIPSGRPIELASPRSPLASIGSIPELPPPIFVA